MKAARRADEMAGTMVAWTGMPLVALTVVLMAVWLVVTLVALAAERMDCSQQQNTTKTDGKNFVPSTKKPKCSDVKGLHDVSS